VCGKATSSLAGLFAEEGYEVSGSDTGCYPPASDLIERLSIKFYEGFSEDNVKDKDLTIVANMFGPDSNPEVSYVRENNLPQLSMSEAIAEFFIKDKHLDLDELLKIKSAAELDGVFHWFLNELENCDWTIESLKVLETKCVEYAKSIGWKLGDFFTPIRLVVCKSRISPPLFESMYLLGKLKVLNEISLAIDKI
jgi:glutamyl/glutaminyl-tRNA synthetase